jgi:putative nucleotidyltransferase with HDIG domain
MSTIAPLLEAISGEGLATPRLRTLDEWGLLTKIIPELEDGRGFEQPEMHHYDVLDHNLATVAALDSVLAPGDANEELRTAMAWLDFDASLTDEIAGVPLLTVLRLGCLLHDIAKPATAIFAEGRLRFPRHGPTGAEMMQPRLTGAGLPEDATDLVCRFIRYHLRPRDLIINGPATDRAIRRFTDDLRGYVLPLMLVNLCDGMAVRGPGYTRENYRRHCMLVNYVVARCHGVAVDEWQPRPRA